MDLSVIIVSYNTKELLDQCLRSVLIAAQALKTEVFVVDNASSDGSPEMVQEDFPQVRLIANKVNVGYSKANNQALRQAEGDYILLLNSDTKVSPEVFREVIDFMQGMPDVGVASCKVVLPDGNLDLACRRSFPTPWVALWRLLGLSKLFPKSRIFARYNLTYLDEDETYEVDAVMGAFMMIKREAFLEVGLLDQGFFMYGEDLDWCYRFRKAGYKVMYYPQVSIWHYKGASSKKRRPVRMVREFHNSMYAFYDKFFAKENIFIISWLIKIGVLFHFYFDLLLSRLWFVRSKET